MFESGVFYTLHLVVHHSGSSNISTLTHRQTHHMPSDVVSFDQPEEVALAMGRMFLAYMSYTEHSFKFDWLEKTPNIHVQCQDTTGQKVQFTTPPRTPKRYSHVVRYTQGIKVLCPHQNHGTIIIRDHTCTRDMTQKADRCHYILKSELMAATSIFYHQMNEMVWLSDKGRYKGKPRYKGGLLTATMVTFICGKVRIIQATIKPSEKHPTLNVNLRAKYILNNANYDKNVGFDVLKWLCDPPQAELETEPESTETVNELPERLKK
ncbi:hypothetical protein MGYG_05170 [Nannizzia gypsea CBS 118893]|uniref:Uncharacterized protein n=1 Tax=Arthroderma gypseum (strain ATCC MYA-4604 / CBS 118893) TaxID=535722 RepID=E4UYK4_ARTGP|nr:hypothetical protein MGYG_05170 [Nannizzia gypsea CBS 118893]EFR02167.1 hypothetical protein MGYG_05170 [Nannizzia gypsea CBS 118893]